jgi:hypothetical protein
LTQTSGTHIRESRWFESRYTLQGKIWPTRHTLSTLSLHIVLDHTYPMWSMYSNLSWVVDRFGRITLFSRKRNSRLHPQHAGWPICGSPSSFSPPHSQWSSRLKLRFCRSQATRLTGPIYQHAIGTFNTFSRGLTHRSLTDTGGGYNLGGDDFPHITPWTSQLVVSTFHLKAPPGLQFNHIPPINPKLTLRNIWPPHGLPTTQSSTVAYIYA